VDVRTLQREVNEDMQATLGDDYYNPPEDIQTRYMEELRQRYGSEGNKSNRVRLVLAESRAYDERLRIKGAGFKYEREF
jgi:hypothetical protein